MWYSGIGGSAGFPRGFLPVSKNFIRPSGPHRLKRSLAEVRSGAVLCHLGIVPKGWMFNVAPLSHLVLSNSPFSSFGVWQVWQTPTFSTKYLPRSAVLFWGAAGPANKQNIRAVPIAIDVGKRMASSFVG